MTGTYIDKNYVYAVARVRGEEMKLLSSQSLSELISAKDRSVIKRILKEKGFGGDSDADFLMMIKKESEKLWQFIDEIVPDKSKFLVFRVSNDFHNLKAAIKESVTGYGYGDIYFNDSSVDYNFIRECIKNNAYGDLPSSMVDVAREAHELFLTTKDSQLCDVLIDRACLEEMMRIASDSNNDFIKMYTELKVASSNIMVCVRSILTNKSKDFIKRALVECNSLSKDMLIESSANGIDAICNYLQSTDYADAVDKVKKSLTSFEKWCDDLIIDRMKGMLYESFGMGPIMAYIIAKQNEIKNIRIVYTAIQNGFSEEIIKERVRETYV